MIQNERKEIRSMTYYACMYACMYVSKILGQKDTENGLIGVDFNDES